MTLENKIKHKYLDNTCILRIPVTLPPESGNNANAEEGSNTGGNGGGGGAVRSSNETAAESVAASGAETAAFQRRYCKNIKNCDVFWDENNFLIYADVQLFRFQTERTFDLKDVKNVKLNFNTKDSCYEVSLPCLPLRDENIQEISQSAPNSNCGDGYKYFNVRYENLWKLRRLTEKIAFHIDDEESNFEAKYDYGFASKFTGPPQSGENDLSSICQMPEPHITSPLQRTIDREIHEMKHFCREQYKLNFVELQIPDGHDNPMKFITNFGDVKLNHGDQCLLHNLTCKPEFMKLPTNCDQLEIDCGLVSILLAICYDVRVTSNESTCESGWTRSILSATLYYFEPFNSIKEVVISFLRRSLTYPLYRNYDLGRLCIEDAIKALQQHPQWIMKQLLITHDLFQTGDTTREPLNSYYIEDYIRYVKNDTVFTNSHRQMVARNLKNVLFDVLKKHLRLNLAEIETELLREIVEEMHTESSTDEETDAHITDDTENDTQSNDEGDDDEDDEEDDEDEDDEDDETDSSSETEENSVIEQRISDLKI